MKARGHDPRRVLTQIRRQATLVAYRAFSDVAGKGAFFLVTLLAARRLSQESFGLFSLGTTVGWIAAVATDFGIQLHLARSVAERPSDARPLLRGWLRVRLLTAGVAVAAVGAGLALASPSPEISRAVFLFTLVYVVSGLVEFLHYFYRGLSRSDIESTLTLWQRLGTLVLVAVGLSWLPTLTMLALAMLVPVVATFWYSARRARLLAQSAEAGHFESGEPVEPREPGKSSSGVLTIGAGILLSALYFRIDVFLIEAWQGTDAVALYNAVFRLVEALRLLPAAVLAVALPVLFQATSRHPLVKLSLLLSGGATAVTVIFWLMAGRLIPLLYGEAYADAAPVFRVLLLSFPLMSLNYALTHQLIGWHGQRAYALMAGAALVFNVALNSRLIPSAGIVGAAWATLATEAVITCGCLIALARLANPSNLVNPSHLANASNLVPSNLSNLVQPPVLS